MVRVIFMPPPIIMPSRPVEPTRCPHCNKVLPQSDEPWWVTPVVALTLILLVLLIGGAISGSLDSQPYAHPGTSIMARITQAMPTYKLMHWLSEPRP